MYKQSLKKTNYKLVCVVKLKITNKVNLLKYNTNIF